jgi:hypothetical protein
LTFVVVPRINVPGCSLRGAFIFVAIVVGDGAGDIAGGRGLRLRGGKLCGKNEEKERNENGALHGWRFRTIDVGCVPMNVDEGESWREK